MNYICIYVVTLIMSINDKQKINNLKRKEVQITEPIIRYFFQKINSDNYRGDYYEYQLKK